MSGQVKEIRGRTKIRVEECNFIWSIENFSLLKVNNGESLRSPIFTTGPSFLTTWHMKMYPSGCDKEEFDGKIGIFLVRESNDISSHFAVFRISFLSTKETELFSIDFEHVFEEPYSDWGRLNVIDRDTLLGPQRTTLLSNDVLRVKCNLKVNRLEDDISSECDNTPINNNEIGDISSLQVLSNDLKELCTSTLYTDFMLQVGTENIPVHKCILSARSPFFDNMFKQDIKEKYTSCVHIIDMDSCAAKAFVNYLYCGQVEHLNSDLAMQLCSAAKMYQIRDLKEVCVHFLISHITVADVCDILMMGLLHDDLELISASKNFIRMNAASVQETDKWVDLELKNPDLVSSLVRNIIAGVNSEKFD